MVNTEIPKNYSASPSSFSGTPLLTINSDVAVDHESSNAFEGASRMPELMSCLPTCNRTREAARSMVQRLLQLSARGHCPGRAQGRTR